MTPEERVNEISKKCGLSSETVRLVLKAEAASAAQSLLRGEHAVLAGRCIMRPRTRDGKVKVSCTVSTSLLRTLEEQAELMESQQIAAPKIKYVAIEQLEGLV